MESRLVVDQPVFTRSGRKFTGSETLKSASIETNRQCNERIVMMVSISVMLKRGLSSTGCPLRLDNMWLAWSFQCNVMLKEILQQ